LPQLREGALDLHRQLGRNPSDDVEIRPVPVGVLHGQL
jgi:hypothetical protein